MAAKPGCRTCGTTPLDGARFCHVCGSPVADSVARAEYKQVTVLFADVVHSMHIAAAVGAERLHVIMSELVDQATTVVQRYGGVVDQFTGDGVMAVFGAPAALEDHAVRACHAALGIQAEIVRLAVDVRERDGMDLRLRVGVNSGQVIAGDVGSRPFRYTAIGEQVGMAQRVESIAAPGSVMVSESTARLVTPAAILGEPELVSVKGSHSPIAVRRLVAMTQRAAAPAHTETSLVGRNRHIATLTRLLDDAVSGRGGVVGVVGDAGIGKSRLVREVAALAERRGVDVVWTTGDSITSDIPLHAISRLVRAATGIGDGQGAIARARIRSRIPDAAADELALLNDLLGIADPAAPSVAVDPDAKRRRMTSLVNRALLARSTPALFIIDDAQWIDDASDALMAEFFSVATQSHAMVMMAYRPDYRGALIRIADRTTLSLEPLSTTATTALVTELLGPDPSVAEVSSMVARRASGNPFFVEELVRDLVERQVLVGHRGDYTCVAGHADLTVPATVQAAISARLDRLTTTAKQCLHAASVIGTRFNADSLTALRVEPELAEAVSAELIDHLGDGDGDDVEYAFHHPLIRSVIYESQLMADRADLHRRMARVIERRDPARLDEQAALIAEHVEAAGEIAEAYGWHMRAAGWLGKRDIAGAYASWDRARLCADGLPLNDEHRTELRIAPRVMLCAYGIRIESTETDVRFEELQELCKASDDKSSLAFGMGGMLLVHVLHGRVREASEIASEYMALVDSIGEPTLAAILAFVALPIKLETGPIAEPLRWAQQCIDVGHDDPFLGHMVPCAYAVRGSARWAQGDPRWKDDLATAVAMSRDAEPFVQGYVVSVTYSAIPAGVMVADDESLLVLEGALQVAASSSDDSALGLARLGIGLALLSRESAVERKRGIEILTQVRAMIAAKRFYASELPIVEACLAGETAANGDPDRALPIIRDAVETLYANGQWGYLSATAGLLVQILTKRADLSDLDEADGVIERLAKIPYEAQYFREVWLLRCRAQVALARGEMQQHRELVRRYAGLARSLGYEGHLAMAAAMTSPTSPSTVNVVDRIPRGRIRRTVPLSGFAARAAGGRIVAGLRKSLGDTGAVDSFHERTAEKYAQLLGNSKGVLMKVGQILSMFDADVLGGGFTPYHSALARLQSDAPPMDPDLAKRMVLAGLGRSTDEVFARFSDEPIAAASIGQVHRAVTHDGREVAVKIQYPGAAAAINADLANHELVMRILRLASSAFGTTMPDMRAAARDIAARIKEELDYRHEAANIAAFSELYRGHPFIRIPDVVREASGDRVLTMTYLDGLNWADAQRAEEDLKNTWAEVIWRFLGGSIRHANLFYADPHPGNYRFGVDGRVGFVDFGCVKVLSERQRSGLVGLARATVDGRRQELRQHMVKQGFLTATSTLDADQAYEWWADTLHEVLAPQPFTYTRADPIRAIRGFLDLRRADNPARHMQMPEETAFFPRMYVSMYTVFATLGATLPARSIYDDMDGVAEPTTVLGGQHHEWRRGRGLPCGLDPRDP